MTHPKAQDLCRAGRRLHEHGLIAGLAGNLSVRLDEDRLLITPRGTNKGGLEPEDMVTLPLDDHGEATRASTELPFHRACYMASNAVGAVVHTHAPALTAAGIRGLDITSTLPELELAVGPIMLIDFAPSGSEQLGKATGNAVAEGAGVILLKNHGAVSIGRDLDDAVNRMELAELAAYTVLLSQDRIGDLDLGRVIEMHAHLADGGAGD
ncbi:MAG: aldolase [Gemmatimonadota bacterium]|nr:MAG: aldolase [Gemmatimonadota bacterium]